MKKIVSTILAIVLVATTWMPTSAAAQDNDKYTYVDTSNKTFESNVNFDDLDKGDRLSLEIVGKKLKIEFACSAKPAIGKDNTGVSPVEYRFAVTNPFTSLLFARPEDGLIRETVDISWLERGRHYLFISRAMNEEQRNHDHYGDESAYRVVTLNVDENGNITIDKYTNIMANNEKLRNNPAYAGEECYLDPSLKDVDFILTDPNKKASALTVDEQQYIKTVSNQVISDYEKDTNTICDTPYKKARAIYNYIGEYVYYDKYANKEDPTRAYLHPARNLRAIQEKGKVATLCTGYSSMSIAMLRAQGIPARLVYGYHLNTSINTWDQVKEFDVKNKSSHYWTEFYVDGKWMTCDTYMAGANKWERNGFDQKGQWIKRGFTNYGLFNPSEHQLAVSHYGQGIFTKSVMAKKNEVTKFKNILMTKDVNGKYNYEKLGMSKSNIDSNGNYIYLNKPLYTYTERKTGLIEKIDWKNKKVVFNGNLKDLAALKWLNLNGNPGVKYLTVSNDKELVSVYASDCRIKNFYALNCPKLNAISTYGNPLTLAKYNFKGKKVATVKARTGGTFRVAYKNGVHTLTAVPNRGYRFTGWYDKSGKRISKSRELKVRLNSSFERRAGFTR